MIFMKTMNEFEDEVFLKKKRLNPTVIDFLKKYGQFVDWKEIEREFGIKKMVEM